MIAEMVSEFFQVKSEFTYNSNSEYILIIPNGSLIVVNSDGVGALYFPHEGLSIPEKDVRACWQAISQKREVERRNLLIRATIFLAAAVRTGPRVFLMGTFTAKGAGPSRGDPPFLKT